MIAGNGLCLFSGDGGPAVNAALATPTCGTLDSSGNYYVRDTGRIRKIGREGIIQTIVGNGTFTLTTLSGDGGPAASAVILAAGPFTVSPGGSANFGVCA